MYFDNDISDIEATVNFRLLKDGLERKNKLKRKLVSVTVLDMLNHLEQ